jgi:acyl carrier protein
MAARDTRRSSTEQAEMIQTWLVARVAELLNVPPAAIDIEQPFADCGLSSMAAVSLSGDLEEWLGRDLPPTLAWDFPHIAALARYLAASTPCPSDAGVRGSIR